MAEALAAFGDTTMNKRDELREAVISLAFTPEERDTPRYIRFIEILDEFITTKTVEAREIFVPVRGADGYYEVSNFGNVRSVKGGRRSGRLLKASRRTLRGYMVVSLCKDGRTQSASVHRLVAKAFISNPEHKPCVNHKDGNPSNNHVDNLEWVTYAENEGHALYVLGKRNSQAKLKPQDIPVIKSRLANGDRIVDIAKDYDVHKGLIWQIKDGRIWSEERTRLQALKGDVNGK